MTAWRLFLREVRGNAATEFAFVFPVMLLFMGGIVEFGRFFQAYNGINRLATRYASIYSDCNDNPNNLNSSPQLCNSSGELQYYWPSAALKNIAPQLTNGTPAVRMFQVAYSSGGTLSVTYQYPTGVSMSSAETQSASAAIYTAGVAQTGVVVTVTYTHKLNFFPSVANYFPNGSNPLNVSYTVAQRKT